MAIRDGHVAPEGPKGDTSKRAISGTSDSRRAIPDGDRGADPASSRTCRCRSPWRLFGGAARCLRQDPGWCSTRTRWCTKQGSQARRCPAPGCLLAGVFGVPERWCLPEPVEEAKACAAAEAGLAVPSSCRPLCMFNTAGKILERIICRCLEVYTEAPVGLSEHQHGLRRGRSTIDAIESVTAAACEAVGDARGSRKYLAVVTLDVRSPFNSARWNNILAALERIRTPEYLLKIIYSYFQARVLELPAFHRARSSARSCMTPSCA
uniref:Reverse transcriptase domain-containing protein n=1 Tax=Trichogramma kaykai TaxID=54128 RepID=A0ABD2WN58_9HYME